MSGDRKLMVKDAAHRLSKAARRAIEETVGEIGEEGTETENFMVLVLCGLDVAQDCIEVAVKTALDHGVDRDRIEMAQQAYFEALHAVLLGRTDALDEWRGGGGNYDSDKARVGYRDRMFPNRKLTSQEWDVVCGEAV